MKTQDKLEINEEIRNFNTAAIEYYKDKDTSYEYWQFQNDYIENH